MHIKESNKYKQEDLVAIKRIKFGRDLKQKSKCREASRETIVKMKDRYNVEKADNVSVSNYTFKGGLHFQILEIIL